MSGTAELEAVYSAIEESARLLAIPCSRAKVWPILAAYGDAIPRAVIAFRVATGSRHAGELDWRFTVPTDVDPYAVAVSNGLVAKTDHPVGTLLADVHRRCPVDSYGVDFGVVGGFKKIYAFFPPDDMQRLETLVDIPAMPRGLAENFSFFARHGLAGDKVNVFGVDYRERTANVYFGGLPAECLEPKNVRSMHRELGLPDPSEQMLKLARQAFGIYVTLGWDSSNVERLCFAVMPSDAGALPVRIAPEIEKFLESVPYGADDRRFIYYAAVSSSGEEYYKLQSYYRWQSRMLNQMLLSDSSGSRV
jgi:Aromatic prenyltransferase Orf2